MINNLVIISDLHCGCRMGLCPPEGAEIDAGDGKAVVKPSQMQRKVWAIWREFWDRWVPEATEGEPYAVVCNGDAIDGVHHNSTTQISHNLEDQIELAYRVLAPVVKLCKGRYYHIRGTEAHVGKSGVHEEQLAKRLGAIRSNGIYARWELRKWVGDGLVHITHHIGTTGSSHYESTAVHKELVEAFTEAGRWGRRPPDIVVRSHRHRSIETTIPAGDRYKCAFTTAAWQLKTPFAFRISGGRQSEPQIGGSLIRRGRKDLYALHFVRSLEPGKAE